MSGPLSIGVVIPTRNCADRMRAHLASMTDWLDLASEVVVVDSHSTDGTEELLKKELRHPNARFFDHPPGLYQSWNFGVQQLIAKYCYIATAGDAVSRDGFLHLYEVAERFAADVVLSTPSFVREDGRVMPGKRWTIHEVLDELHVDAPAKFLPSHFFITSALNGMSGIMGSSASNLYRSATFKERPFSAAYGHVGDVAWGVANAFETSVAITPKECAQFLTHANGGNVPEERIAETEAALLRLARETLRAAQDAGKVPPTAAGIDGVLDEYEALRGELRKASRDYYAYKNGSLWPVKPGAWISRLRRDKYRRQMRSLWRESMAAYKF